MDKPVDNLVDPVVDNRVNNVMVGLREVPHEGAHGRSLRVGFGARTPKHKIRGIADQSAGLFGTAMGGCSATRDFRFSVDRAARIYRCA